MTSAYKKVAAAHLDIPTEYIRADLVPQWQPIETAPDEPGYLHMRGVWVCCVYTGMPLYFAADVGWLTEDGEFELPSGDDTGWRAEDYDWWCPVPKVPEFTDGT